MLAYLYKMVHKSRATKFCTTASIIISIVIAVLNFSYAEKCVPFRMWQVESAITGRYTGQCKTVSSVGLASGAPNLEVVRTFFFFFKFVDTCFTLL
jgi:hypothetical protein